MDITPTPVSDSAAMCNSSNPFLNHIFQQLSDKPSEQVIEIISWQIHDIDLTDSNKFIRDVSKVIANLGHLPVNWELHAKIWN